MSNNDLLSQAVAKKLSPENAALIEREHYEIAHSFKAHGYFYGTIGANQMNRFLDAARAEGRSSPGEGWHSIDSAPKDGTKFVSQDRVNYGDREFEGTYWYVHPCVTGWNTDDLDCGDYDFEPTHWRPQTVGPADGGEAVHAGQLRDELEGVISDLESSGWARAPGCIRTLKRVASSLVGRDEAALQEPVAWRVRTANPNGSWGAWWIATEEPERAEYAGTFGVDIVPLGPIAPQAPAAQSVSGADELPEDVVRLVKAWRRLDAATDHLLLDEPEVASAFDEMEAAAGSFVSRVPLDNDGEGR